MFAGFSELAGWGVALVLGGGLVLSLILVGTLDALVGTAYGWIVLAKVSLFAPMLAIGAWNRYRVLPGSGDPATLPVSVSRLARNVRFEAVLGAVVLALAAVLTAISPVAPTNPGEASLRLVAREAVARAKGTPAASPWLQEEPEAGAPRARVVIELEPDADAPTAEMPAEKDTYE